MGSCGPFEGMHELPSCGAKRTAQTHKTLSVREQESGRGLGWKRLRNDQRAGMFAGNTELLLSNAAVVSSLADFEQANTNLGLTPTGAGEWA